MMKKVIMYIVVSLFVFSGFVAGPLGPDLGIAKAAKCSDLPNVEACILIKKGGKVEVVAGNGKKLKKPKKKGGGSPGPAKPGISTDIGNLPSVLKDDITGDTYIQNDITIYGDKTCVAFNGVYYCW